MYDGFFIQCDICGQWFSVMDIEPHKWRVHMTRELISDPQIKDILKELVRGYESGNCRFITQKENSDEKDKRLYPDKYKYK